MDGEVRASRRTHGKYWPKTSRRRLVSSHFLSPMKRTEKKKRGRKKETLSHVSITRVETKILMNKFWGQSCVERNTAEKGGEGKRFKETEEGTLCAPPEQISPASSLSRNFLLPPPSFDKGCSNCDLILNRRFQRNPEPRAGTTIAYLKV